MFSRVKKTVKRNAIPSVVCLGTLFSSAGTSLFGTIRIFELMYSYFYTKPDDAPEWAQNVEYATYMLVILTNMVIIADTRFPAIFREYRKYVKARTETHDTIAEDRLVLDAVEEFLNNQLPPPNGHNTDLSYSHAVRLPDNDPSNRTYMVKLNKPVIKNGNRVLTNGHNQPAHGEVVSVLPGNVMLAAQAQAQHHTYWHNFAKQGISSGLKFLGFSSITFSSLNTYLGSITLFEYIGGDPAKKGYPYELQLFLQCLEYGASGLTVGCKFFTNYSFIYPATKKNADKLARWIMGEHEPLEALDERSRYEDFKNWMGTIGLSFFNIVSSPFLAFYSTEQTMYRIPVVCRWENFIEYFSGASTFSSLTNDIISKSPSVHKAFLAWRSHTESGSDEIKVLMAAHLRFLTILGHLIFFSGWVDSLATGANLLVSVINTSNKVFEVDRFNPYLFFFALLCGISSTLVNYAFSVRRGHRDFMKLEIYPYVLEKGWLNNVDGDLPEVEEEPQFYEVVTSGSPLIEAEEEEEKKESDNEEHPLLPRSIELTELESTRLKDTLGVPGEFGRVSVTQRSIFRPAPSTPTSPLIIAQRAPAENPTNAFTM